ncbi:uncharacterized protein LOC143610108 [Bidens hawaiensis]|uniref:uncharacterized protein LOC143610108 n=1 Tax=Bidens hawaiensis TaxID=980011 RepID=UPI00404A5018
MMMMGTSSSSSNQTHQTSTNVFTASQWEELEQQALIYKYMVSGVPVPTDLILSVRRSLYTCSSPSSSLSHHPTLGGVWEAGSSYPYNQLYQMSGYGRKIDLEPGRCRRTDGKKWRCSKEAYPDSKYCERHMHRGRNRSRKPVEFTTSSSSSSVTTATTLNVSSSSPVSKSTLNVSSHPYPSFSSIHSSFLDSSPYSHQTLKDYRNLQGMKDLGEDERSATSYFQLNDHHHQNYSHFSFQNLKDHQKKEDQEAQGQHCFVMGTDFIKPSQETNKSSIQIDTKVNDNLTNQQPFHHFFSTPKTTLNNNTNPDWVNVDTKAPLSTQDLFQSKPRPYW